MANFGYFNQCINVSNRFMTRSHDIRRLQHYIVKVYGPKDSTTLQSLCEEYKFKKDRGENANCQLHPPGTICLMSEASATPMVSSQSSPLRIFPTPPAVISPEGEMVTCTPSHQPQTLGSTIRLRGSLVPVAQRLRPDATEFVPNRPYQAKSRPTEDPIEQGLGTHMGVVHDSHNNSIRAPANIAVQEEGLATASTAESAVMSPVNGLVGPKQNDYAELAIQIIGVAILFQSFVTAMSTSAGTFPVLPAEQRIQAIVTTPSDRMAMLLQDTEPTSPSDDRYGPIGLGRPGP